MLIALLAAYAVYGAWLARKMVWCDGEMAVLPAGQALLAPRWAASFPGGPPYPGPRLPWRLPGMYGVYGLWIRRVDLLHQRAVGRLVGLTLSLPGVALTLLWAQELGGWHAALAAGLILLSSATLVGSYSTASYEGLVASLWLAGLWGWLHGWPWLAAACGLGLVLLRHTSFWQGLVLVGGFAADSVLWTLGAAAVLTAVVLAHPALAQEWRPWQKTPPPGLPRDGWRHGCWVLAQRYEPMAGWCALALLIHRVPPTCALLLGVTAATLLVTHGQRAWWRPKWVIGYLPDFALPVVLVLAVAMAPALERLAWWPYALLWLGWGLWRRRHPALP